MPEMTDEEIAIEAVRNLGYGDYPKTTSAESAFGYAAAVEALRIALPLVRERAARVAETSNSQVVSMEDVADAIRKIGEGGD